MTTRIEAIRNLPVEQLRQHPDNIRAIDPDDDTIDELAASLTRQGILQPLLVAPRTVAGAGVYVVLDGNRRLVAARTAGIPVLPCLITTEGTKDDRAREEAGHEAANAGKGEA